MGHPKKSDWDPQLYLKYENERTRPSVDLVNRIHIANAKTIVDIGCGPGNSTQVLARRWPESKITGLDNSFAMIEKAKKDYPKQEWILADAGHMDSEVKYDIVFSNAVIQWIPDHEKLLKDLFDRVEKDGALAIQLPMFRDMPLAKAIEQVAQAGKWRPLTGRCHELFTYHDYGFYHDTLTKIARSIDMWETSYVHVMDSHEAILEWIRSTGMKPYLERLEKEETKNEFESAVLEEIRDYYPLRENGKALFPFKRLFFIAYR